MDPFGHEAALADLARAGAVAFAMEFMPRITRAQSMDVLSSQANLAGYRAVIEAAAPTVSTRSQAITRPSSLAPTSALPPPLGMAPSR
jgi:NAD(P) transhydrogenase subunit alpha